MLTALGQASMQTTLKAQQWLALLGRLRHQAAGCIGEAIDAVISGADLPPCATSKSPSAHRGGAS